MSSPEKQLAALHAVARALAGATATAEVAPRVLEALALELGFESAAWWRDELGELQLLAGWRYAGGNGEAARSKARASRRPEWMPDGTVVVPLLAGDTFHGVVELRSSRPEELRDGLLQTAASVGLMLGQFVDRHDARHLHELFNDVPVPLSVLRGPNLVYELQNAAAIAISGDRRGKSVLELGDRTSLVEPLLEVLRTGKMRVLPEQLLLGRYYTITLQPLRGASGAVTHVVATGVDVTDQVQSRQRVEQLANALPEVVWTVTPEGNNEFFNRRWYELTGLPLDRAGFEQACHPDDLEAANTAWTHALSAGAPYEVEVRLKRASDGSWRWHLVRGLPITDEAGKISKWVGSATDIDDHKRAEETSRLLAQASVLLGSTLDYESTLQTIARLAVPKVADWCSVYLQDEGEALPRQLVVAHSDPKKVEWARELQKVFPQDPNAQTGAIAVIRTGQPEFFPEIPDALLVKLAKNEEQLRLLRQIGFSSGMTVPLVAHGRTFGAITLVRAESRTRYTRRDFAAAQELANLAAAAIANARLYRDAQRAIQVRDEFLSVASHELKTPLTPLQLHVQSLQKRAASEAVSPRVASKLDAIGRQVNRMERLINSMLDVSRVSTEAFELDVREVDLAALAREVGERFRADVGRDGVIVVDAPDEVRGFWDPLRVDQILTNLISNAVKFGGSKPVEISVRGLADGRARLEVRDHGIGIAPEDQQRIFERFERAVAAMSYGGLGLGLWIARELVERMGGTIRVASTPGDGATFTVELPQGHGVPAEPPRPKEVAR